MQLVLDEPAESDVVLDAGGLDCHLASKHASLLEHCTIRIEYFDWPRYKGFSVKLQPLRGAFSSCC